MRISDFFLFALSIHPKTGFIHKKKPSGFFVNLNKIPSKIPESCAQACIKIPGADNNQVSGGNKYGRTAVIMETTYPDRLLNILYSYTLNETGMKTTSSRPVLSQTENNTTLWIGHLPHEHNDHLGGQTFGCPSEGQLNNIQVFTAAVTQPGELVLTLHPFDPQSRTWGEAISRSVLQVEKKDAAHWLRFELEPVNLLRNGHYGFRLQSGDGIIGIGEAISHAPKPFPFGQAWSRDGGEHYFSYFSLAFRVELCA